MEIRVTASKWVNGCGWSYTTDLDPLEIDSFPELHDAAQEYAASVAEETPLDNDEDLCLNFYAEGTTIPAEIFWVKETAASAATPAAERA